MLELTSLLQDPIDWLQHNLKRFHTNNCTLTEFHRAYGWVTTQCMTNVILGGGPEGLPHMPFKRPAMTTICECCSRANAQLQLTQRRQHLRDRWFGKSRHKGSDSGSYIAPSPRISRGRRPTWSKASAIVASLHLVFHLTILRAVMNSNIQLTTDRCQEIESLDKE